MKIIAMQNLDFVYSFKKGYSPFSLSIPSWSLESGSKVVLYGPSGCGKSTLLNLICGMMLPQAGQLIVCGKNLSSLGEAQRRVHRIENMGFVFQDFPLVEYLSAIENVLFPYRINPALRLNDVVRQRALALLTDFDLVDKRRQKPAHLSQGERQRVAIARALITSPKLLLADEPTAGLDPDRAKQVLDKIDQLVEQRNLSLVLVTHDPVVKSRFEHTLNVGQLQQAARR